MTATASARACAICMSPLSETAATACPVCRAEYHAECWIENGGCAVYGCSMVPKTEGLKALEIPPAFWGREDKECPRCGMTILAMAVRCRHCGAAIEARPEERVRYEHRVQQKARAPRLRRQVMLFLILALVPIAAVVTATAGLIFRSRKREELKKLSGSAEGLLRIGIAVAWTQSIILVLGVILFYVKDSLAR